MLFPMQLGCDVPSRISPSLTKPTVPDENAFVAVVQGVDRAGLRTFGSNSMSRTWWGFVALALATRAAGADEIDQPPSAVVKPDRSDAEAGAASDSVERRIQDTATRTSRFDTMTFESAAGRQVVEGKLTARNSVEVLFTGRDGQMYLVDADKVIEINESRFPFQPFTRKEMIDRLREEFGAGFDIHETVHYVICYNSDREFARSCGQLFERLHAALVNYFKIRKFAVQESEFPLVAVVFASDTDFRTYAQRELGDAASRVIGYYSLLTNRMVLYDMVANGSGAIDQRFTEVNIATIIHESTHQLAYNAGFHRRFSVNPLWLAEGMAMYFEAPDRRRGDWKRIGEVNPPRLTQFREYLTRRSADSLASLIRDDTRVRNLDMAGDAYAEAWALTYFLIHKHQKQYFEYLKILSQKPALGQDGPDERLADFRLAFGEDLQKLDAEFVRYLRTVR